MSVYVCHWDSRGAMRYRPKLQNSAACRVRRHQVMEANLQPCLAPALRPQAREGSVYS